MKQNSFKLLKVLFWPIIFMIGQFFIRLLFVATFNNRNYSNTNLSKIIKTSNYQLKLNNYLNNNTLIMVIIIAVIFIPLYYFIFKKYQNHTRIKINKLLVLILFSMSFALFYNAYLSIICNYHVSELPLYVQIICSGLIGPIIEELIFRGIIFNKLKETYSINSSMVLTTVIFALFHASLTGIIYTFIFGYMLVNIYQYYKDLRYSILMHISANIIVILFGIIINMHNISYNLIILAISFIFFLYFSYKLFTKTCFNK